MEFKISLARVTGSDHSLHNIPCQDKTAVFAGDDYTTAALADGAGSRPYNATTVQSLQPLRLQAS